MAAGYSGTPLVTKLGLRAGQRVLLLGAPGSVESLVRAVPRLHVLAPRSRGAAEVALLFVTSRELLARRFESLTARLGPAGALWVCWPKKSSGVVTDVTEDTLRSVGLPTGWVDNKVCAVDDTWSALRFVLRRALRPVE